MKVIELTCPNHGKHDIGVLLTEKERKVFFEAVEEYTKKYKRRTFARKMYNYMYKHLPV